MSTAVPLPDVRRALVVTAHPDDVDFGAAGMVATSAGGDGTLDRAETARVRQAAECLTVREIALRNHPDGAEATFAAGYPDARNPHAHPQPLADEGPQPWTVRSGPPARPGRGSARRRVPGGRLALISW